MFNIFSKKTLIDLLFWAKLLIKKRLEIKDLLCRLMIRWSEVWTRATRIKMIKARFFILVFGPTALIRGQRMKSKWNPNLFNNQTYTKVADCSGWIVERKFVRNFIKLHLSSYTLKTVITWSDSDFFNAQIPQLRWFYTLTEIACTGIRTPNLPTYVNFRPILGFGSLWSLWPYW